MAIETTIQSLLHAFDQGRTAFWIRRITVALIMSLVALMWFAFKFNGFSVPEAMDQAQIGRQLASGKGFSTLYARPLAMHLGLARTGRMETPLRETSQAPLGPLINAATFRLAGMKFALDPGETITPAERAITAVGFLFLVGSLVLSYLLGCRLFDQPLARQEGALQDQLANRVVGEAAGAGHGVCVLRSTISYCVQAAE